MSEISDNCTVAAILADYASVDAAGKANLIGAGISFLGFDQQFNVTAPFALYVEVSTPLPNNHESEAILEIVLADSTGKPVELPGQHGAPEAIRISNIVDFKITQPPGTMKPTKDFPSKNLTAINFANGLTLIPGVHYQWIVKVDGVSKASTSFQIPRPSAPPVIG